MDNQCVQCGENGTPDSGYKGTLVYMCPNTHRWGYTTEESSHD